jgi:teichuronic acid biosynthesis glycosyltransferase TuaC
MKVLHISHVYPVPHDRLFGLAMHRQIYELSRIGCEIRVIAPIPLRPFPAKYISRNWAIHSDVPVSDVLQGIAVFYPRYITFPKAFLFSTSGRRMYSGIKHLVRAIRIDFPFDLIHAHMGLPDGYAGMMLARDYRNRLVATIQATDIDISANRSVRCLNALKAVLNGANRIISPSPRLSRELLGRFGISPVTIGYGVDPNEYCPDPYQNEQLRKYKGRRILLSVSRLTRSKGIELVLLALKQLISRYQKLDYIVIGDGPEKKRLHELVQTLGIQQRVIFLGNLSHQEVMEYMGLCEVFCLPSWQETFGLVYVEAMLHGKPVVGCRGQGIDGLIVEGKSGLLTEPRDVGSLINALDFLLDNSDAARRIGEEGRKLVLENYTWETSARKCMEIYEEVL